MRVAIVVVMSLLAEACIMTPPLQFGSGPKTGEESEHVEMAKLMPTALDLDDRFTGEVRTVNIHVWADDDYRSQNLKWQRVFQRDLDDINEATAALFGIRFAPEFHEWNRRAPPGAALVNGLAELAEADPGADAFAVIGLTSAVSAVAEAVDYLGFAQTPGRYIILRGYATGVERAAFDRSFPHLDREERDAALEARRRHQATTVMLHEPGHTLGATHDDSPDTIMHASNSIHAAGFSPTTRAQLQAVVDQRVGRVGKTDKLEGTKTGGASQVRHPSVVLRVTETGEVRFGGQPIDLDTLSELLHRSFVDDAETEIVLAFAHGAPSAIIGNVSDRAKAVGLHRVSVQPLAAP